MDITEHAHTNRCWWNPDQARWICSPEPADRPLVDVRDMIIVHTAMLREFRLAPAAVRRTEPGDRKRAAVVDGHLRMLCDLLHHHHDGEDELLWPKVRARSPQAAAWIIDDVEAQHDGIDAALQCVQTVREAWAAEPDADRRDQLVAHLEKLHVLLREHLELEEQALLPLAASVLTQPEWDAIGEAAVASTPKPTLLLMFGMFAYEGDPAVLRAMISPAPPPARVLLPRIAPRVYARRARRVHGTARP